MRKRLLKNRYLRKGLLFFGILISLTNCEKGNFEQTQLENQPKLVNEILNKINPHSKSEFGSVFGKKINIDKQDFTINTNYVKYIEYENYHSFTFYLIRKNPKHNKIENLILNLNDKGLYDTYVATYNFTKNEYKSMSFEEFTTKDINFEKIDFDYTDLFAGNIGARMQEICVETQELVSTWCCDGNLCTGSTSDCIENGGTGKSSHWVTIARDCTWISSGGTNSTETGGDTGSTTDGSSSSGGSTTTDGNDKPIGIITDLNIVQTEISTLNIINYSLNNPITSEPIELYLIAEYKFSEMFDVTVFEQANNSLFIGEYTVTPHFDRLGNLVFYAAARQNGKNLGIEYIIRADALQNFSNRISFYTYTSNLFYAGGVPSQGQIAMAAGDYWSGLGSMWNDAIHSPEWWAYTITSFGHAIANLPVNSTISSTQTVPNWRVSLNKMTSKSFQGKVVTNPQGVKVTIDIPDNYVASIVDNGKGLKFMPKTPIGTHPEAGAIRIMQPTTTGTYPHPKGYVKFYNSNGQPYNPINGQTLGDAFNHFDF